MGIWCLWGWDTVGWSTVETVKAELAILGDGGEVLKNAVEKSDYQVRARIC